MRQVCLRLLLRATTAPPRRWSRWAAWRGRFEALRRAGWQVRVAAPKHYAVWAGADDACRLARCIVLPGRVPDLTDLEAEALLESRLRRLGLSAEPAPGDDPALCSAEHKVRAAIAPPWTGGPPALPGPVATARRRR